jgi:hypothetical protein
MAPIVPPVLQEFGKQIDLNMKVMEGKVKLRRTLFFFKKRKMILLEDGKVIFAKENKIKGVCRLDRHAEITLINKGRFQLKTPILHEVIESSDAEVWVNILNSIKSLSIKMAH